MVDLLWMTGGKQGSGIDAAQELFSRIMIDYGYETFGYREYFSNIKGAHSFFTVRVCDDKKPKSIGSQVDLAVFYDKESVFGETNPHGEVTQDGHIKDIKKGGTLIVDKSVDKAAIKRGDIKILSLDFDGIVNNVAQKLGKKASDVMITKNVIAVTASAYVLGFSGQNIETVVKNAFSKKSADVIAMNVAVSDETLNWMKTNDITKIMNLKTLTKKDNLYMEGFAAAAIGKAIAGCKMQVYYPITPASDESIFLESHPELGVRVVQPESELAVIGMTTGAAIAGVRAALSTSGPGLSLMTETITYAGMCEVPIVLIDHQRGAPATGQPTRTEQADLLFAVHAGHGDFDRIVLAPGDAEEYIEQTAMAFNYAEKYQVPVIVLGEKAIAQSSSSMQSGFVSKFKESYVIDRGKLIKNGGADYKRFKFTDDGISDRIMLGDPTALMWTTGDEHDEWGHISEEPHMRMRMMEKRTGKGKLILSQLSRQEKFNLFGDAKKADLLIVGWGGPSGPILEGMKSNMAFLQLKLIEPLPSEAIELIKSAKKAVCVEQNISGQLREHIASKYGVVIENQILKYNGRPMRYDEVSDALDKVMTGERKVILNGY